MRRRPVLGLILNAVLCAPLAAQPAGLAEEAGRFVWELEAEGFGGFSGLEVSADGATFTALSDRGRYLSARIERDGAGRIIGIAAGPVRALVPPAPGAWAAYEIDSEGLAIAPDGTAYVSFEGIHTVFRFDGLSQPAVALPQHADFAGMIANASLEALAIGPEGALYTLPERSGHLARPFPIYRFADGAWHKVASLPRRDDFLPVGADFGPDGLFYLLERRFSLVRGFASRVRRFSLDAGGLSGEELLFESRAGRYHDLEGLAVWRDADGRIRLTMISDDNFNFLQATEIVEYVLREDGEDGVASEGAGG